MDIDIKSDTDTSVELDFPSLWGVQFLNDDFTPMEFVISIMMKYFNQSFADAQKLTMLVHDEGEAVVGAYTKDIAVTKAATAEQTARQFGHPLRLEAVEV